MEEQKLPNDLNRDDTLEMLEDVITKAQSVKAMLLNKLQLTSTEMQFLSEVYQSVN